MKKDKIQVTPLEKRIGPMAVQEYIQDYIETNPWDVLGLIAKPKYCDPILWLYEHTK